MTAANENQPKASAGKCPICGKPTNEKAKPFCSKRCSDVDLQRWLSGRYAIPAVEADKRSSEDPDEE